MNIHGNPAVFPDMLPLVDDGTVPDGSELNVPIEALADRTAYLKAIADAAALRSTTDLQAINTTSLADQAVRNTPSGLYIFNASIDPPTGEDPADYAPWMVAPTTGPGMWILEHPAAANGVIIDVPLFPHGVASCAPGTEMFTSYSYGDGTLHTPGKFRRGLSSFFINEVITSFSGHLGSAIDLTAVLAPYAGMNLGAAYLHLIGAPAHAALPLVMPCFGVELTDIETGFHGTMRTDDLAVSDSSANVAAYEAHHFIEFVAQKNRRITKSATKAYTACIFDEGYTNALVGTTFWGLRLNLSV